MQLEPFAELKAPEVVETYHPLPVDLTNAEFLQAVAKYNATGSPAALFAMLPAVQTAAYKIINKRLGLARCRERRERAEDVALRFLERLQRRYRRGKPYQVRRVYSVLWDISTYVLYNDSTKQADREVQDENL